MKPNTEYAQKKLVRALENHVGILELLPLPEQQHSDKDLHSVELEKSQLKSIWTLFRANCVQTIGFSSVVAESFFQQTD